MMGIGKAKDLDEWLMGSGESAETADSKKQLTASMGASLGAGMQSDRKHGNASGFEKPAMLSCASGVEPADAEDDGIDDESDGEDGKKEDSSAWMFSTFDKQNRKFNNSSETQAKSVPKPQASGLGSFDPFQKISIADHDVEMDDVDDGLEDIMLDGGMHLLNQSGQSKQVKEDCASFVADKCMDLDQFISRMDEIVHQ